MAKKQRSYFFDPASDTNSRGYKKNFQTSGEPDEALMTDLIDSVVNFSETDDRAKQSTGVEADADLVGHVQIATDVEAKANTSGLEVGTTKVVHAGQLPTVDATEAQTVGVLTDNLIEVAADGTSTRNNFLVKLKETFRAWLNTLRGDVDTNTTNIATNTSNIATNTANISTNTANIANNTTLINNQSSNGTLAVKEANSTVASPVKNLNFDGADFDVTDNGGGQATVQLNPSAISPVNSWTEIGQAEFTGGSAIQVLYDNGSSVNSATTWSVTSLSGAASKVILGSNTMVYSFAFIVNIQSDSSIIATGSTDMNLKVYIPLDNTGETLAGSNIPTSMPYLKRASGDVIGTNTNTPLYAITASNRLEIRDSITIVKFSTGVATGAFYMRGQITVRIN
jgi:hypothetical protein